MLSLEPILTARLEEIAAIRGVHGLPEFADATAAGKMAPCLYLVFDGYGVLENSAGGDKANVETRWLVICAAKHAGRAASGGAARNEAALLLQAVLGKLLGWRPGAAYSPLKLAPAPRAASVPGTVFVPLAFTSRQIVSSAP